MEIVINIPEDEYNKICSGHFDTDGYFKMNLKEAFKNAILLPKGHGRLIDEDEAIKCIKEVEGEDAIWAIGLIEWACSKRTLIEADKEGENG